MATSGSQLRIAVLCASPRAHGRCAHISYVVEQTLRGRGYTPVSLSLSDFEVHPCNDCGACQKGTCVIRDDVVRLVGELDACEGLVLVSPIFFAGPPAQLKAFFDRLQPLWAHRYLVGSYPALPKESRRPLVLCAVGAGGDPFGYEALATCAHSALRMLDFELQDAVPVIGNNAEDDAEKAHSVGVDLADRVGRAHPYKREIRAIDILSNRAPMGVRKETEIP